MQQSRNQKIVAYSRIYNGFINLKNLCKISRIYFPFFTTIEIRKISIFLEYHDYLNFKKSSDFFLQNGQLSII